MFRIDRNLVHIAEAKPDITPAAGPPPQPGSPEQKKASEVKAQPKSGAQEPASDKNNKHVQPAPDKAQLEYLSKLTEETLEKARLEADKLLQSAEMAAKELKEAARQEGYACGLSDAKEVLATREREDAAMIRRLLTEIERARDAMFDQFEEEIVNFGLAIAKKIVNVAIKKDDKIYESMLKKALKEIRWEGKITIRVSSEEYSRFFASGSAAFVLGDESITATVVEDPGMNPGDCVIESDSETINAGVDSQFKALELAFHKQGRKAP